MAKSARQRLPRRINVTWKRPLSPTAHPCAAQTAARRRPKRRRENSISTKGRVAGISSLEPNDSVGYNRRLRYVWLLKHSHRRDPASTKLHIWNELGGQPARYYYVLLRCISRGALAGANISCTVYRCRPRGKPIQCGCTVLLQDIGIYIWSPRVAPAGVRRVPLATFEQNHKTR